MVSMQEVRLSATAAGPSLRLTSCMLTMLLPAPALLPPIANLFFLEVCAGFMVPCVLLGPKLSLPYRLRKPSWGHTTDIVCPGHQSQ